MHLVDDATGTGHCQFAEEDPTRWHAHTPPSTHPWRRGYQHMKTPQFPAAG